MTNHMPPLRWGVLGGARIAEHFTLPAMATSPHAVAHAVASRRAAAAQRLADRAGTARAYTTYQDLLEDPAVDAVYIALPNSLHTSWTLAALAVGKHVLCEKPLATTVDDVHRIAAAAREADRTVAEAFMYRTHPQFAALLQGIRDGVIGEVHNVEATLSFTLDDPDDIRMSPDLGGGSLLDLGCYLVDAANQVFGRGPHAGAGTVHREDNGVIVHTAGALDYGRGSAALLSTSFLLPWYESRLTVRGDKGSLVLDHCFNPGTGDGHLLRTSATGERFRVTHPGLDMYAAMFDHFARAVAGRPHVLPSLESSAQVQEALSLLGGGPA
ncbi:Gfo/Idh/MocA family oxidoreductase [Streptomyces luomodiensis]|uniref:Gfo/Idh/MocA family oxidoreductase n=1 Tax=Streptomyces luomodiensis TaxID=3026192 RepID=A0ABY9UMU6_9ACTN|nr:Gfo/Idh/MocA family oxidoreductase [Streptomyces sp. SCA4-21]WNE93863.1 Gfo/Idh/MocA family oxidoreductase [Streptomyces sp. SCA4-21]